MVVVSNAAGYQLRRRYRFTNQAHLKHPAAYAPQFGGFCAMGVALGKKRDGVQNLGHRVASV